VRKYHTRTLWGSIAAARAISSSARSRRPASKFARPIVSSRAAPGFSGRERSKRSSTSSTGRCSIAASNASLPLRSLRSVTNAATTPASESRTTAARTSGRVGTRALWIAAAALLATPAVLAFATGGRRADAQAAAAIALFALLGAVAALAPWPLVERSWPLAALAALVAFCGWTALSASWSRAYGDAVNDADRVALYAVAFGLAVIVMRAPGIRRVTPDALLWGIVAVMLWSLAGRMLPELIEVDLDSYAGDRLHQPIGYWNATGVLAAFGALLATGAAADERRPVGYRAAACAAAVPCALACYLTLSRASWAALAAGLIVLMLLRPRVTAAIAAGLWLAAAALLVGALRAFDAVLYLDRGESARMSDGVPVLVIALVLTAAVGMAFARLGRREGPPLPRPPGWLAVAVVPVVLAAAFAVSFSTERTEEVSKSAARVTTLKTFRGDYWRVALDSFADHPAAGVGAASFQIEWTRERDTRQFAFDAHSLYVETLAELGLVGALLLAAFAAAVALGLRRRRRAVPDDPLLATAGAVLAAFAIHAGVDWDWEVPAVTLPALLLAAAALQRP
jgi:hypothetical protein